MAAIKRFVLTPAELVGGRFGVKEFHHPQVLEILRRLSPENRLLELIPDPEVG